MSLVLELLFTLLPLLSDEKNNSRESDSFSRELKWAKINGDEQDLSYNVYGIIYNHDEMVEELRNYNEKGLVGLVVDLSEIFYPEGKTAPIFDRIQYVNQIKLIYDSLSNELRNRIFD